MSGIREQFFKHLAQTSPFPLALEISHAEGMYLYQPDGKSYLDLISGIAVSNLGHQHPDIIKAIQDQASRHLHLLVYGELVQSAQVQLAQKLSALLPPALSSVYFTNSGTEAVEGAIKLAKRFTGRTDVVSFRKAYHGSTQGALSICGEEWLKNSFRPLIPGCIQVEYNDPEQLELIDENIAAVVVEPIQAEAGVIVPDREYLKLLADRCRTNGVLLIFDEIQTGMRRTGSLFAFEDTGVIPDILLLGKGFGGGMPLGAFIASYDLMKCFTADPVLGHITTFGGHPVSCAAALASLNILEPAEWKEKILRKEKLFRDLLRHKKIKSLRGRGLFLALEFEDENYSQKIIQACLADGILTDWFLFAPHCMRIAPPLIISEDEIRKACTIILKHIERN